jgi:hypothetical protein
VTFVCPDCGKKHRAEVQVPDTRARLQALQLWLEQSLGRIGVSEEMLMPALPANVAAVQKMHWDDMQALFAAIYVDEIAIAQRDGGKAAVRKKLMSLSETERQVLREALAEPELV